MRFLHISDVHLGNQQYNHKERYNDFYLAFKQVAELAVEQRVQTCVIAGDLFHKGNVDPQTLLQAEDCLSAMREAGIKVLAVAGNHDRARYRDEFSWLEYLQHNAFLTLLHPLFSETPCLTPGQGYVDLDGVRFIGVPYLGSATRTAFERLAADLDSLDTEGIHFTVLITHAGIEGEIPNTSGCVSIADLMNLARYTDYVATGHLHKPFVIDQWIHNPGAIENCDFNEENYRALGKGVFIVDVEANSDPQITKHIIHGRRFHTLLFQVDSYLQPDVLMRELRQVLQSESQKWHRDDRLPVVRVILRGNLAFDRTQLDPQQMTQVLESDIECLLLRLQLEVNGFEVNIEDQSNLAFDLLEQQVFEELARSDARYSPYAESWGALMREIKDLAIHQTAPSELHERLQIQMQHVGRQA